MNKRLFSSLLANNAVGLLDQSMKTWKTELKSGKVAIGEVKIKWVIFQSDTLLQLLFVLAIIALTSAGSLPVYKWRAPGFIR